MGSGVSSGRHRRLLQLRPGNPEAANWTRRGPIGRAAQHTRGNSMTSPGTPTGTTGNALETAGLGKRYGGTWALRDCTFTLPAGRVGALVGPNGAGKTTLLHLATGLIEPSTGTVRVFGRSPREQPKEVLPRIGFVAQDHPLYGGFTVAQMHR